MTLLVAIAYSSGWIPLTASNVAGIVILGGTAWLLAAFVFASIREYPGATDGGIDGIRAVIAQLGWLRSGPQLRWLICTRSLLLSTALAPPFYVALSGDREPGGLGTLGLFMMASAVAGLASSYFWGKLADRSSRRVLIYAASLAALANGLASILALSKPHYLSSTPLLPAMLFVLVIAHQGVRFGRSIHVIDMADPDTRATYSALSNSVVGLILLVGGVFGFIAQVAGIGTVLVLFTLMAALAIPAAARLDEVQAS